MPSAACLEGRLHPRRVGVVWLTMGAKHDRGRGFLDRGAKRPRRYQPFLTTERGVLRI